MEIITALVKTKQETLEYFNLSPLYLSKTYSEGKWNIKQILVHLADAESVLLERIKRVIAEPKQVIWAFNQDLWCNNLDYENFSLELSKEVFIASRNLVIYLAEKYYNQFGKKEFVHNETGLRTLKDEFDKVASHNEGHLSQIRQALNKT